LLLLTDPVPLSHGATQADWFRAFPWVLTGINVVGVYLVTLLLAGRFRHLDPNSTARVGVVTGFFGGFTSYSSLYVDLGALCRASLVGGTMAILVTAVTGLGAVWLGLRSAR
jgi:fluoride ion exporter CrcB/FEX